MSRGKEKKILVAGSGGQGVMLLGRIIAEAAVLEDRKVTYLKSYGAAMRGGTANCWVKISNKEIATPVFEKSTISVILNSPSLNKFGKQIEENGYLIVNSSMTENVNLSGKGISLKKAPLNDMALGINNIKTANVIALGCLIKNRPFVKLSSIEKVLENIFKGNKKMLEENKRALKKGLEYD